MKGATVINRYFPSQDEPTTVIPTAAPTTPYITTEEDKHTIHIQPPDLPLKIELPEEQFRPDEKVITIDANKIVGLRAARVAARPVQTAEEVSVLDGSGDAPANGEEGLEIALNKDLEGSGVEGSGTDDIVAPVTPAICPEVPYPRIVPESGILDTVAVPVIDRSAMPVASSAEEKSIVTRYKEKDGKKDKKNDSSSSSSEEVSSREDDTVALRSIYRTWLPALGASAFAATTSRRPFRASASETATEAPPRPLRRVTVRQLRKLGIRPITTTVSPITVLPMRKMPIPRAWDAAIRDIEYRNLSPTYYDDLNELEEQDFVSVVNSVDPVDFV